MYEEWAELESIQNLDSHVDSQKTLQTYFSGISNLVGFLKAKDPDEALKLMEGGEAERRITRWIGSFKKQEFSRHTQRVYRNAVRKWLEANDVWPEWRKVPKAKTVFRLEDDRPPTREELQQIFNYADLRMRVVVSMLVSSGLRIGALRRLKLGNLVKHDHEEKRYFQVNVPLNIAKGYTGTNSTRLDHYTFITPEASALLEEYLEDREERLKEELTDESPVITYLDNERAGQFVKYRNISGVWGRLLDRLQLGERGGKWRRLHIHTLRKFFRSKSQIHLDLVEFFMGHKRGTSEGAYFMPEPKDALKEYSDAVVNLTIQKIELEKIKLPETVQAEVEKRVNEQVESYMVKERDRIEELEEKQRKELEEERAIIRAQRTKLEEEVERQRKEMTSSLREIESLKNEWEAMKGYLGVAMPTMREIVQDVSEGKLSWDDAGGHFYGRLEQRGRVPNFTDLVDTDPEAREAILKPMIEQDLKDLEDGYAWIEERLKSEELDEKERKRLLGEIEKGKKIRRKLKELLKRIEEGRPTDYLREMREVGWIPES